MIKKYPNKGIAIWDKQKEKYHEVIKKHRIEKRVRKELSECRKGDEIELCYRKFPPEKIIIDELEGLKEEEVLEYILAPNSIKIKMLKILRKTRNFSKELRYVRGMVYRGNHYYMMADSKGKNYRIPSKKMSGFKLHDLFLVEGRATGRKVTNIRKIEIVKK